MNKITEYKVIMAEVSTTINRDNRGNGISKKVNEAIQEGWQPLGGVMRESKFFFQAMVKTTSNNSEANYKDEA